MQDSGVSPKNIFFPVDSTSRKKYWIKLRQWYVFLVIFIHFKLFLLFVPIKMSF